jgi:hypothetical protein
MQQRIAGGMAVVTQGAVLSQPSKAELRAMVPEYDESLVKRIPPGVKGKPKPKG